MYTMVQWTSCTPTWLHGGLLVHKFRMRDQISALNCWSLARKVIYIRTHLNSGFQKRYLISQYQCLTFGKLCVVQCPTNWFAWGGLLERNGWLDLGSNCLGQGCLPTSFHVASQIVINMTWSQIVSRDVVDVWCEPPTGQDETLN